MGNSEAILVSNETPDDVATLYSWANLRGAKYRDFSAARARVRETARQRVQDAMEAERRRAESVSGAESAGGAEVQAAGQSVEVEPSFVDENDAYVARGISAITDMEPASAGVVRAEEPASASVPLPILVQGLMADAASDSAGPGQVMGQTPGHHVPQWFALKGIMANAAGRGTGREQAAVSQAGRAAALAVFSLAGGVGKSCLVATLGRALSARGERVLLVDTAAFGTLQFFFGAHDQRPGVLRTFSGPDAASGMPVDLLTLDMECVEPGGDPQEPVTQEILRHARGANRILIDLATASSAAVRRILRLSPTVLVPVTADVRSVASVCAIDAFFQRNPSGAGQTAAPHYVLNQFDEGRRLHQDVRAMLQAQLGERLLPFVLHRAPAVSEALAEGMTVMDYAPGSPIEKDYEALAGWVQAQAAPAQHVFRGVRWSER